MKAILTYHSIDDSGSVISVHPDLFQQHIGWLTTHRVPVLPIAELLSGCSDGVSLTFDDGYENFADVALPILRRAGLPATVFVASGWVGQIQRWDATDGRTPQLSLMGWDSLRKIAQEGVELGSHTRTHPDLTSLGPDALRSELQDSRAEIEREAGVAPAAFAYPYGRYDANVVDAVAAAGYERACTTDLRLLPSVLPSPLELPRIDAYYLGPKILRRWGTPAFRRYMQLRNAGRSVRRLLTAVGPRS